MTFVDEKILILDFGSQLTQLIARRVRENGVYSEIRPYNISDKEIKAFGAKAIILSGGPASVSGHKAPTVNKKIFEMGVPILGICYGQQLMCDLLGGKVEKAKKREFGRAFVDVNSESELFKGVWKKGEKHQVWMSHGDSVVTLPKGFKAVAGTEGAPFAVVADENRRFYGIQFHPEVVHTLEGKELLKNFTHRIAGCKGNWNMAAFLKEEIKKIKQQVGNKKVICAVSGGVDSSVVAALIHKAIGNQLHCVFVDTGLLRLDEAKRVKKMFAENFHIKIKQIDASKLFLGRLKGVTDPEKKRKIIGKTFIDVFEKEAKAIKGVEFLAQGTLYPDVIESVSSFGGPSVTIKSHHNVGGLPARMKLKLIEPVRELFKDEVRRLGLELGMHLDMVKRHPFPGPGLAIRMPGEITKEKLEILRQADAIFIEELHKEGLYDQIWQAYAALLPVKTVGVMGDSRSYEYICMLRAVTSTDGMTADFFDFQHSFLSRVSNRIVGEVRGINRVVYDVTSKPPATIELE